jgi:hypothetical protein
VTVDGLGSQGTTAVLTSNGTSAADPGSYVNFDVGRSLAAGVATTTQGTPAVALTPSNGFVFAGDATGVAGSSTLTAAGAALFNALTPGQYYAGQWTFGGSPTQLGFTSLGPVVTPTAAGVGAFGSSLAVLGPGFITVAGVPRPLVVSPTAAYSGLSESFQPELAGVSGDPRRTGAAVINVLGATRRYVGTDVRGLVLNARGSVNLIAVQRARNSVFLGNPITHVDIQDRRDVQIISTARGGAGTFARGGVRVVPSLPVGGVIAPPDFPAE